MEGTNDARALRKRRAQRRAWGLHDRDAEKDVVALDRTPGLSTQSVEYRHAEVA